MSNQSHRQTRQIVAIGSLLLLLLLSLLFPLPLLSVPTTTSTRISQAAPSGNPTKGKRNKQTTAKKIKYIIILKKTKNDPDDPDKSTSLC